MFSGWAIVLAGSIVYCDTAIAQVVPDASLSTAVVQTGDRFTITQGDRRGTNVFHSFSQFSVPTGGAAIFDNPIDIQRIFGRVTGGSISTIDGLIQANGEASLFLLNPNGILFGSNARLNVGGSFLASTASRIQFADGGEFAIGNSNSALLSVTAPIGLQMGALADGTGAIGLQGPGNNLTTQNSLLAPYSNDNPTELGLQVAEGKTLALVGGAIAIEGAVLSAPQGRVELASLGNGAFVSIREDLGGVGLAYRLGHVVGDRLDIQLSNKALIDVNAVDSGSIQVQGRRVDLTTGALLWGQNRGAATGGDITVTGTDRIFVDGTAPDLIGGTPDEPRLRTASGIVNETLGANGGNIALSAPTIRVQNGGSVLSRSFTEGTGCAVQIEANALTVSGASAILGDIFSLVGTLAAGPGAGGQITLSTQDLALLDGGVLSALTIGPGNSGDIAVKADTIEIGGLSPILSVSSLSVPSLGGTGAAGNLHVDARAITLRDGGIIASTSFGPGNAGNVVINAADSIDITGFKEDIGNYQSGIASSVSPAQEPFKSLFNIADDAASGSSGNIAITTRNLRLTDNSYIVVSNIGIGSAGMLTVNADRIELKNQSYMSSQSFIGQGGDLVIRTNELLMRYQSDIHTEAGGFGNGGDIDIQAKIIVSIDDSDIFSGSLIGQSGRIQVKTEGLFGIQYRDRLTLGNDITSPSKLGQSGDVLVSALVTDLGASLVPLPIEVIDLDRMIVAGCGFQDDNQFAVSGKGGLFQNPIDPFKSKITWADRRSHRVISGAESVVQIGARYQGFRLIEARSIQRLPDSKPQLVSDLGGGAIVTIERNNVNCLAPQEP
jgi:filamentous hemagglutinin family protein